MRFTEHELTAALTGAAKVMLATDRKVRKSDGGADAAWQAMDRYARFQLLDGLGDQILPVLVALPDVEVAPGTRASYSSREISAVVEEKMTAADGGKLRRAVAVKARTMLVQAALASMPPRIDPDALINPE